MSNQVQNLNEKISILGVPVNKIGFFDTLKKIDEFVRSGQPHQIATVNAEFIMGAQKDRELLKILQNTDLNTPDGMGTVWAAKYLAKNEKLKTKNYSGALRLLSNFFWLKTTLLAIIFARKWLRSEIKERVTGIDLMWEIANLAQERGWSIYLLGAGEGVATEVAEKLTALYPRLQIAGGYSGRPEETGLVEKIAKTKPDILFVAFGNPKQEKFIFKNKKELGAKVMMGVGGSFDFITGRAKRAPQFLQKLGLEWFWRLIREPKRALRIYNATVKFVWSVFRQG